MYLVSTYLELFILKLYFWKKRIPKWLVFFFFLLILCKLDINKTPHRARDFWLMWHNICLCELCIVHILHSFKVLSDTEWVIFQKCIFFKQNTFNAVILLCTKQLTPPRRRAHFWFDIKLWRFYGFFLSTYNIFF